MITRYIDIENTLEPGKVLVLLGPRRSGKTTLLQNFTQATQRTVLFVRGDEVQAQNTFSQPDSRVLLPLIGAHDTLVIDEAQMIPDIGKSLKLLVDTMPGLSIVATGSSAFELAGQIGEPLTGRKRTRYLLPIAPAELYAESLRPSHDFQTGLSETLRFGLYPNVITAATSADKEDFLRELVNSYLLKDILAFQEIKGSRTLIRLLALLAYQVGGTVSLTELGNTLDIDRKTVERYLDLLEKTFVIFRLGGYSRNLRNEITKMAKYYFYDVGVRNAIIENFNVLDMRNDLGQLWENFVVAERQKKRLYYGPAANQYFWRTWQGSEIDLIEEREGTLHGYEVKWSDKKPHKTAPAEWLSAYPNNSSWQIISPTSAYDFLRPSP